LLQITSQLETEGSPEGAPSNSSQFKLGMEEMMEEEKVVEE
jgi:hypothetical protein